MLNDIELDQRISEFLSRKMLKVDSYNGQNNADLETRRPTISELLSDPQYKIA